MSQSSEIDVASNDYYVLPPSLLDTIQDFLFELGMQAQMYISNVLVDIIIFSLYHVVVRPTYQNY